MASERVSAPLTLAGDETPAVPGCVAHVCCSDDGCVDGDGLRALVVGGSNSGLEVGGGGEARAVFWAASRPGARSGCTAREPGDTGVRRPHRAIPAHGGRDANVA